MDVMTAAFGLVNDYPGGAVALAHVVGKNPATLSHEVNPNYPAAKFGLADAAKLSAFTDDRRIAAALASQVGCMLLPLPDVRMDCTSFGAVARLAQEFSDLVQVVSTTVEDGKVSPNELDRVQREAAQLVAAVEATVGHLSALLQQARYRVEAANA